MILSKIPNKILRIKNIKGIKISVTGYEYKVGTNKIKKELNDKQYNDFCIYIADTMLSTIVEAIDKQRYYSKKWKPLSIKYLEYKKRKNLSLNVWEATGTLKDSIKMYRKGNYIVIGFKNNDRYRKSGIKINTAARWLEYGTYGTKGMQPRPLFRPITLYFRKNISRYYKSYKKELDKNKVNYLYLS